MRQQLMSNVMMRQLVSKVMMRQLVSKVMQQQLVSKVMMCNHCMEHFENVVLMLLRYCNCNDNNNKLFLCNVIHPKTILSTVVIINAVRNIGLDM